MLIKFLFLLLPFLLFGDAKRDLEIYREAHKNEPNNVSHFFSLAEALKDLNEYEEAIIWYRLRLQHPDDKSDQIWSSKLGLAACYERLDNWPEALYWYLEAYALKPISLDPILYIAKYYRMQGKNDLAYIFAKHGTRFHPSTDYRFDEELSIVSFYTRYREDGYKAVSDLLLRKGVPWHVKSHAYRNLLYYIQNLKNTRFQKIELELPFIANDSLERYYPMNPSLIKTEEGYTVICRSVNYTQKGAKDFQTNDPEGYFRTRNFLLHYDRSFRLLSSTEILDESIRERYPSCIVQGLEDCRLFEWQKELWFTATARDTNPEGIPQIALGKIEHGQITRLLPLNGPEPFRCEKNWLPFIQDGELNVIYAYDPFTVYKPNLLTGNCEALIQYQPLSDFSFFRGSAGPIPFDHGYLLLIHEPVIFQDGSRCYVHRFVYADKRFTIKLVSKPFTFLHQGVEFCCSMTIDHSGETLILALGIEDSSAYFCFTDLHQIRSLLCPLESN